MPAGSPFGIASQQQKISSCPGEDPGIHCAAAPVSTDKTGYRGAMDRRIKSGDDDSDWLNWRCCGAPPSLRHL
jgi:hypothetical protein